MKNKIRAEGPAIPGESPADSDNDSGRRYSEPLTGSKPGREPDSG